MDPLTALLFSLWIAGYFTKNVYQDAVFRARGEDPPSFRREQARWERRQARAAQRGTDGPGRQFWRNVWADAIASADERRERTAANAAKRRRAKWTDKDLADAEDEAHKVNERLNAGTDAPASTERTWRCTWCPNTMTGDQVREVVLHGLPNRVCPSCYERHQGAEQGEVRRCHRCSNRTPLKDLRGRIPVQLGIFQRVCPACSRDIDREDAEAELDPFLGAHDNPEPHASGSPCHFCQREFPVGSLWADRDGDIPVDACADCWNRRHGDTEEEGEKSSQPDQPASADPVQSDAKIIQFADWQRPAASDTEKEPDMSAEITGLQSGIAFAEGSAAAAVNAAAQDELAIASLQAGGTTGPAIAALQSAMEAHQVVANHYRTVVAELTQQLQVKEAYEANQGAGTREFVTAE